jgi:undecaprenyl-phosphate galactose phosphotransferase
MDINDSRLLQGQAKAPSLSEMLSCEIKHFPLKRAFDIIFSLSVLILCSPLFLILAFMVRISSKGNVFYYQERIGRNGDHFHCYKFRTMFADADRRLNEILKNDPVKRREWEQKRKLKNDPRITPIGNFLRKTSLDELPQFWNVLKGDLSVVGPRPVVQDEIITHYGQKADKILSIRPGITGLWQVSGRSDVSYQARIALDEQYVKNRSFFLDLKLVALTIPSMITRKGAY